MALIESPGTISDFSRERGWGTVRLDDGRELRFDATVCTTTAASGARVQVRFDDLSEPVRVRLIAAIDPADRPSGWLLDPGEPIADAILSDLERMGPERAVAWKALIEHAATASGAKPSAKWLKTAGALIAALGDDDVIERFAAWFPVLAKHGPTQIDNGQWVEIRGAVTERASDVLRGFAWMTAALADAPRAASVAGDLALASFRKVPNVGAVSSKVGNACLWSLGGLPGVVGAAQLGRVKARVRYATALRLVDKALTGAAERAGLSVEDLEEIAVPTCGLDERGRFEEPLGACAALGELATDGELAITFRDASGKVSTRAPDEVKAGFKEELGDLKARAKEAATLYPAQVVRLEGLLARERVWAWEDVFERFLVHGLTGAAGRRLLWCIEQPDGTWPAALWEDGRMIGTNGLQVRAERQSKVRLWHPLGRSEAEIAAWRSLLVERGLTQPVKQAFRETYVAQGAEIGATHSTRFAGHVLRQHQLAALCRERGWQYSPPGTWASFSTPTKPVRDTGITASFVVEAPWGAVETSPAGSFVYVRVGALHFDGPEGRLRLDEIPGLIFSELMRDVDLFVGAATIATDAAWHGSGAEQGRQYFAQQAWAELGASARVRGAALAALLPRLAIEGRIDGKFLVVQGKRQAYRVHLGSGHVLAEPSGRFITFPTERSKSHALPVALPFEGDGILRTILERALMLADEAKIRDPELRAQLSS